MEIRGIVTSAGSPLTLLGHEVSIGDPAPEFQVLTKDMKPAGLSDFNGKIKLISVTPSLDTSVCDTQARRFNQEAQALSDDIVILNISMDLPFAAARFCASAGIEKVITLSDHREASFGMAYGILIKELRLLARAIFVVDGSNVIRYIEIVPDVTQEPDYAKAITAAKAAVS